MKTAPNQATLADTLQAPMDAAPSGATWSRLAFRASLAVGVVVAALLAWSAAAPLSGAVIANGRIKTELNRKVVQHQEGGIVREILVREGQTVKAGEPLLVVGDVRTNALLDLQQDQQLSESIRHARLSAELKLANGFALPSGLERTPAANRVLDASRPCSGSDARPWTNRSIRSTPRSRPPRPRCVH